jgi:hypothetical protein
LTTASLSWRTGMTGGFTGDSMPTVARIAGSAYAATRCHVE